MCAPHRCSGRSDDDRGFTLIEILVTIVLVGILSAVVVVGIGRLTTQGSGAACTQSSDAARAASTIWFTSNLSYPATLTDMVAASPAALTLPNGVSIDSGGTQATGSGWTLTMAPGANGGPPTFTCSTTGGASANVPISTGLITHYDASATATLFQDPAGTAAVTANGQPVCRWGDLSGGSGPASQGIAAQCPTYGTDANGGYVRFSANGSLPISLALSPDVTAFVVEQSNTPAWNTWGGMLAARGANGLIMHPWINTNQVGFYVVDASATYHLIATDSIADVRAPHVYEMSISGSGAVSLTTGVDGATVDASMAGIARDASTVSGVLGSDDYPGRLADITYREVLVYSRALGDAEIARVDAYLKAKWGVG